MRYLNDHNVKSLRASVDPEFGCSPFQHGQAIPHTARGKEEIVRRMTSDHFILISGDMAWSEITPVMLREDLCVRNLSLHNVLNWTAELRNRRV